MFLYLFSLKLSLINDWKPLRTGSNFAGYYTCRPIFRPRGGVWLTCGCHFCGSSVHGRSYSLGCSCACDGVRTRGGFTPSLHSLGFCSVWSIKSYGPRPSTRLGDWRCSNVPFVISFCRSGCARTRYRSSRCRPLNLKRKPCDRYCYRLYSRRA